MGIMLKSNVQQRVAGQQRAVGLVGGFGQQQGIAGSLSL